MNDAYLSEQAALTTPEKTCIAISTTPTFGDSFQNYTNDRESNTAVCIVGFLASMHFYD